MLCLWILAVPISTDLCVHLFLECTQNSAVLFLSWASFTLSGARSCGPICGSLFCRAQGEFVIHWPDDYHNFLHTGKINLI